MSTGVPAKYSKLDQRFGEWPKARPQPQTEIALQDVQGEAAKLVLAGLGESGAKGGC